MIVNILLSGRMGVDTYCIVGSIIENIWLILIQGMYFKYQALCLQMLIYSAHTIVQQYFGFASKMLLAFGLVFELHVVIFFLAKLGLVTIPFLKKHRKYALLLAFVVGAILTPSPDAISQCLISVPLIALYELGIIVARFARPEKKEEKKVEEEAEK